MITTPLSSLTLHLTQIPDPGLGTSPPGAAKFTTLISWGAWAFFAVCVVGILYAGAKMIYDHQMGRGGSDGTGTLIKTLIAAVLGASASSIIGVLAA